MGILNDLKFRFYTRQPWKPFQEYFVDDPTKQDIIGSFSKDHTEDHILKSVEIILKARHFMNNKYRVAIFRETRQESDFLKLDIRRFDDSLEISRKDLQRIKNELLGEHVDAFEMFQNQDYYVDTEGHHIHCMVEEGKKYNFELMLGGKDG